MVFHLPPLCWRRQPCAVCAADTGSTIPQTPHRSTLRRKANLPGASVRTEIGGLRIWRHVVMHTQEMLRTHPTRVSNEPAVFSRCIDACYDCAQTCTACADDCLAEPEINDLIRCIRLDLDCADVCGVTGRLCSRQTEPDWTILRGQIEVCADACRICAEECERHAERHEHCRICAESCRECEQACSDLLRSQPSSEAI